MFENILIKDNMWVTVGVISLLGTIAAVISYRIQNNKTQNGEDGNKTTRYLGFGISTFVLQFIVMSAVFYFMCAGDEKSVMMEHVKTGGPTF